VDNNDILKQSSPIDTTVLPEFSTYILSQLLKCVIANNDESDVCSVNQKDESSLVDKQTTSMEQRTVAKFLPHSPAKSAVM
jgi:hypothetical protein